MRKNVGSADKIIRISLAAIILVLVALKVLIGLVALILLFIGLFLIITSLFGFCPVFRFFGFRSNKKEEKRSGN
jgi:fatty acid desaturase